jgi:hypothetical protein
VQTCRDFPDRRWNRRNCALSRALAIRLQDSHRQFFDEQGNAVRALYDVVADPRWQLLVADDVVDHCPDFAFPQPIDRKGGGPAYAGPLEKHFAQQDECSVKVKVMKP